MALRARTAMLLTVMAAVAVMLPVATGRPQARKGYGSWGTFSGIGGSGSLSGSGSLGTNVGLGFHHSSAPRGAGGQYGLNVFGGKTASGSGNGAVNFGAYEGGYRHPVWGAGYPVGGAGHPVGGAGHLVAEAGYPVRGAGHPVGGSGYSTFGAPNFGAYGFMG